MGKNRRGLAAKKNYDTKVLERAVLPELPYPADALDPWISPRTVDLHYGKHHRTYAQKTHELIRGSAFEELSLPDLVRKAAADPEKTPLYNNASQLWNHTFYWLSMRSNGGGRPSTKLLGRIEEDFSGFDAFVKKLGDAAFSQFGSGWAWLVLRGDRLEVEKTSNADSPLTTDGRPLLTIDVWEHAYYLDYENRRQEYITAFLDHLVDWEFAEMNLVE